MDTVENFLLIEDLYINIYIIVAIESGLLNVLFRSI